MSDLVGNPEDRFSRVAAQMFQCQELILKSRIDFMQTELTVIDINELDEFLPLDFYFYLSMKSFMTLYLSPDYES